MNEAKRIEVLLYGESYSVISDEPEETVLDVAKQVDELMRLISRRTGLSEVKKVSVLSALKLAISQRKLEEKIVGNDVTCKRLIDLINKHL